MARCVAAEKKAEDFSDEGFKASEKTGEYETLYASAPAPTTKKKQLLSLRF